MFPLTVFPVQNIFEYFLLKYFGFVKGGMHICIYTRSTHEIWAQQPSSICGQQGSWAQTDKMEELAISFYLLDKQCKCNQQKALLNYN
jgi:hypothetical protein